MAIKEDTKLLFDYGTLILFDSQSSSMPGPVRIPENPEKAKTLDFRFS